MRVLRSCIAVVCMTALSLAAQGHSGSWQNLSPSSSGDDTAQLQSALAKCTNPKKPCDLRLAPGVFHTDVLLVKGFHGSITGSGQSRTIIRPLETRALRSSQLPFFADPTLADPYPALLHFAEGGKISISRLTLDFPESMRVAPWDFYLVGVRGIDDALIAAILVDGDGDAELQMTKVSIVGRDNESSYGSNLFGAVRFEGEIRFDGDIDVTRRLKRGRLVAHHNTILRSGNGISVEDVEKTVVRLHDNELDTRIYALLLTNLSASSVAAWGNIIRAELEGIFVAQTPERPPQKRSDYLLAKNIISINEDDTALDLDGVGYDGIGVFDFAAYEEPPRGETFLANVTIWDNDVTVRDGEVLAGFTVSGDGRGSVRLFGNRLYGTPTDAGVYVDLSRGTFVAHNDLGALDGDVPGVYLSPATRDCRVREPNDQVVDDGVGNHVVSAAPAAARAAATRKQSFSKAGSRRSAF